MIKVKEISTRSTTLISVDQIVLVREKGDCSEIHLNNGYVLSVSEYISELKKAIKRARAERQGGSQCGQ